MRDFFDWLFDLPRTFLAWVLFHLASWLDMRVIPNDEAEDLFEHIFAQIKDVDKDELNE